MRRPILFLTLIGGAAILALWALVQPPGSLWVALAHPLRALLGTERQLSSTLLEVSETAEPVRAAGRRLLQPLGVVRLVRVYESPDSHSSQKKH